MKRVHARRSHSTAVGGNFGCALVAESFEELLTFEQVGLDRGLMTAVVGASLEIDI